jgi:hypothetical protein
VVAGLFTLLPGRIMHTVVFGAWRAVKSAHRDRRFSGRKAVYAQAAPEARFAAAPQGRADLVSLWKNEGKNRSRGWFGGPQYAI